MKKSFFACVCLLAAGTLQAAFTVAFKAMNDYRASVEDDFVCNFQCEAWSERFMKWPHPDVTRATRTSVQAYGEFAENLI